MSRLTHSTASTTRRLRGTAEPAIGPRGPSSNADEVGLGATTPL